MRRSPHLAPTVVIRAARGSDGPALRRLAELDSSTSLPASLLVAETDDELVAALSVETGERVADPFRRTADVVDLLAYRARGLRTVSGLRGLRPASPPPAGRRPLPPGRSGRPVDRLHRLGLDVPRDRAHGRDDPAAARARAPASSPSG